MLKPVSNRKFCVRLADYPADSQSVGKARQQKQRWSGGNPEQHLYGKDHYEKLMKKFWELDVYYNNYSNRTDYITACLKAGIKKAFEEGFTVGGIKVKAKKPVILN